MIHTISDKNLTAKIDTLGSQLISLTDKNGTEYIWQREAPYWSDCAPIPFPVVGRCKNGVITVDGKDYPMAECHGFAPISEFTTVSATENSVTLQLCDSEYTRAKYPFSFCFEVTHKIENDTLSVILRVVNTSDKDMPFGVGGHPGFRLPLADGETFTDYELDFGKPVTLDSTCVDEQFQISATLARRILTDSQTLPLERELFVPDALIFENPPFHTVLLKHKKNGKGIRFSFENFTTFALWTETLPVKADFLCLEPWNGMGTRSDEGTELVKKKGTVVIAPQKEFVCSYNMSPLSIL